jgi:tetratricopeptide (TPR) repeat protein
MLAVRIFLGGLLLFSAAAPAVAQASLTELQLCLVVDDATKQRQALGVVFACTKLINDTSQPPEILAKALRERAMYTNGPDAAERSLVDIDAAIRLMPKDGSLFFDRANLKYLILSADGGDKAGAASRAILPDINEAIRLGFRNADVFSAQASAYLQLENWDKTIESAKIGLSLPKPAVDFTTVQLKNSLFRGYFNRAKRYEDNGDKKAALADLKILDDLGMLRAGAFAEAMKRLGQ